MDKSKGQQSIVGYQDFAYPRDLMSWRLRVTDRGGTDLWGISNQSYDYQSGRFSGRPLCPLPQLCVEGPAQV